MNECWNITSKCTFIYVFSSLKKELLFVAKSGVRYYYHHTKATKVSNLAYFHYINEKMCSVCYVNTSFLVNWIIKRIIWQCHFYQERKTLEYCCMQSIRCFSFVIFRNEVCNTSLGSTYKSSSQIFFVFKVPLTIAYKYLEYCEGPHWLHK